MLGAHERKFYRGAPADELALSLMKLCVASPASTPVEAAHSRSDLPTHRLDARRTLSAPIVNALKAWLEVQLPQLPDRGDPCRGDPLCARALAGLDASWTTAASSWTTTRSSEPSAVALGRKNHLFAGSDGGGARWAVVCRSSRPAKLNGVEPYAYLKDVLERMADGYPVNRLDELLPWAWRAKDQVKS